MTRKILLAAVFVFFFTTSVLAAGFEPGVNVRAIEKDGTELVGVITNYVMRIIPKFPTWIKAAPISNFI